MDDFISDESTCSIVDQGPKSGDVVNNESNNEIAVSEVDDNPYDDEELSNVEKTNDEIELDVGNGDAENHTNLSTNLSSNNKIKLIKSIDDRMAYYLVQEISSSQYNEILRKKKENKWNSNLLSVDLVSKITDDNNSHNNIKNSNTASQSVIRNERIEIKDGKRKKDWKIKNPPFVKLNKLLITEQGTISITSVIEQVSQIVEVLSTKTNNNNSFRIIKRRTKLLRIRKKDVNSTVFKNAKKLVSNAKKKYLAKESWTKQSTKEKSSESLKFQNKIVSQNDFEVPIREVNQSSENVKSNIPPKYKCFICKKGFRDMKLFKEHIKIHTESEYICTKCNKSYKYLSTLRNHLFTVHSNEEFQKSSQTFSCLHCPFNSKSRHVMVCHQKVHTRTEARYTCDICNGKYNVKHWFLKHASTHK